MPWERVLLVLPVHVHQLGEAPQIALLQRRLAFAAELFH